MRRGLKWAASVALIVGLCILPSLAQISVTSFTTSVPVATLNSNFSTLGANALNRTGGTITGNIPVNSGVTIDGVDISASLGGSGTPTFSTVTVSSSSASALDVAGGVNAGSGNVGIVDTSGRIPAFSGTYFANLSGANITGLTFAQLPTTWSTPGYSGGNFTTNGAGGWTVDSGDVIINRYVQLGKTLHWNVLLATTTITAATGTELRLTLPASLTVSSGAAYTGSAVGLVGATQFNGVWQAGSSSTYVTVYQDATLATAWTAGSTQIRLNMTFEVQ